MATLPDNTVDAPFDAIEIQWSTPLDIAATGPVTWDKIHVYRSGNENSGYKLVTDQYGLPIGEIPSQVGSAWVTTFDDTSKSMAEKDGWYYLVRYYNTLGQKESKFYLAVATPSPREQRFIEQIKCCITPWLSQFCSDTDILAGIKMAISAVNMQPPNTGFNIDNFPVQLEPLLLMIASMFTLLCKYLGVALTDLNYSDMGLSLNIDRGAKIKQAVDMLMTTVGFGGMGGGQQNGMLALAKMDYIYMGSSVGTIQLPVSLGGNMNKGMLNVLDLMSSLGR